MQKFMEHDFNITKIALACFVPPGSGEPVHKNRRHHGLVLYNGDCCFDFEGKKLYVSQNEIIYLPKHANYTVLKTDLQNTSGCYAINFDMPEQTDFTPFSMKVKNTNGFFSLFRHAETCWRTKSPGYQMECKATLYNILLTMRKEFELGYVAKSTSETIEPALLHIHQNYTNDNISIKHLADLCGMSETYFRRIFKKATGISPLKYINDLKLARAKELLSSRMYSVSRVAALSGFHDEAYFSREFKKATGISPIFYARKSENKPAE